MNGQVKQYGTLYIDDSKMDELFSDIKRVADQAGLFAIRQMRVYDEGFDLLCSPESSAEIISFDYSYFEDIEHDKVTIDFKTGNINIGNTGFAQFGVAVQALSMLAESYSNSFFCNDNRVGSKEMHWLSCVLRRPLTLPCHTTVWDAYEEYIQHIDENSKISSMEFFNSYVGDAADFDDINTIVYVNDAINDDFIDKCINDNEPTDRASYGYWVRSMARFLWLAKRDSVKTENELLDHFMRLLHNVSKIRDNIVAGKSVSPVKELFAVVAPPITVKLIATIYGLDFWQLWRENKAKINVTSSIFYHNEVNQNIDDFDQSETLAPITTEEFFGVAPEDRLYWWRENGDVIISDKTQRWLEDMAEQHKIHCETMGDDFSAVEWHERLVKFLGKHNDKIKMFDATYCDFLNSFFKKEYRAWVEMMEVLADADITECRRLISVISNQKLRKEVFGV